MTAPLSEQITRVSALLHTQRATAAEQDAASAELSRIALMVARMERTLDEIVAEAQDEADNALHAAAILADLYPKVVPMRGPGR